MPDIAVEDFESWLKKVGIKTKDPESLCSGFVASAFGAGSVKDPGFDVCNINTYGESAVAVAKSVAESL